MQVAEELRRRLVSAVAELRIGDGLDDDVDIGPLISDAHRTRVTDYLDIGVAEGAELVVDGRARDGLTDRPGFFLGGSLFDHAGPSMRIHREEISFLSTVRAGVVGVNVPLPVPMAHHSFGGWKRSLFGDHHIHGPEGVRFYTRYKTATTRWPGGPAAGAGFAVPTHS